MESEGPAEKYRAVRSSRQCCESCEVKVLVPPIACSGVASIGFAKLRSVELVGDELSVPGQQRIRFRDSRQFFQGLPFEPVRQRSNALSLLPRINVDPPVQSKWRRIFFFQVAFRF